MGLMPVTCVGLMQVTCVGLMPVACAGLMQVTGAGLELAYLLGLVFKGLRGLIGAVGLVLIEWRHGLRVIAACSALVIRLGAKRNYQVV